MNKLILKLLVLVNVFIFSAPVFAGDDQFGGHVIVYPDGVTFRVQGQPTPFWTVQGTYSSKVSDEHGAQVISIKAVAGGNGTYGKSVSCKMREADVSAVTFAHSLLAIKSFNSSSDLWIKYYNGKCASVSMH